MIYILQNAFPIASATIVGLLIGLIWLRLTGVALPSWRVVLVVAFAEFWLACILAGALILAPPEAGAWAMSLGSAVIIWVGFVLPTIAVTFLVGRQTKRKIASVSAHWLVLMMAQAAVMQGVGLVSPVVQ